MRTLAQHAPLTFRERCPPRSDGRLQIDEQEVTCILLMKIPAPTAAPRDAMCLRMRLLGVVQVACRSVAAPKGWKKEGESIWTGEQSLSEAPAVIGVGAFSSSGSTA